MYAIINFLLQALLVGTIECAIIWFVNFVAQGIGPNGPQ